MIQFQTNGLAVFESALQQTTSTVVETDHFILVVDPNWLPHEIKEIQQYVAKIRNGKELYLLFTHGDFDHIIGYGAFPDAKVIASKGLQNHPNKSYKLELIQQFDNDYYISRPYPIAFPNVDIVIEEDGETLKIGDYRLTFYLSPGHTHDGLFTVIEPSGIWITGDYLSDFELPLISDGAKNYNETLEKAEEILRSHTLNVLVPGHGQIAEQKEEMFRRIKLSREYLNRLVHAVRKEDEETIAVLEQELPFQSSFTAKCHTKNIAIIQDEYIEEYENED
ncbi:MBL fold metallo-hydrolase [Priestia megaterium]|nr:MBL fold metallo-hydrolase [Priestia megaterium]